MKRPSNIVEAFDFRKTNKFKQYSSNLTTNTKFKFIKKEK